MIKPIPKISDGQRNSNGCHVMFQINQLFNFNVFQCNHIARFNFGSSTIIIGNSCRLVGEEVSGWEIVWENWNTGNRLIRTNNSWCSTNYIFIWDHVGHVCNLHSFGFDIEKLKNINLVQWKSMKSNERLVKNNIYLVDAVKSSNPVHIKVFIFHTEIEAKDFGRGSIRS